MAIGKILVYAITVVFMLYFAAATENGYISETAAKAIKNDLPSFIDLMVYLPLLNRIVGFCEEHKRIMSLNLAYGLFLINANLEPFSKDQDIPIAIRHDINGMLSRSAQIRHEFNQGNGRMRHVIAMLTENSTQWASRLTKLNVNLLRKTYAAGEYPTWKEYIRAVDNLFKGTPNPAESDKCMAQLSQVPLREVITNYVPRCDLPENCTKYIVNGTDFGYSLTHRFILLLMARFGRRCALFSPHEDNLFRINFCQIAYREAQFIALNDFEHVDLMLEQIALCSIDGHAQFLRRSWLLKLLDFQQSSGCFQLFKVNRKNENIKKCDDHATAVGGATYAAAARFLLEKMKRLS